MNTFETLVQDTLEAALQEMPAVPMRVLVRRIFDAIASRSPDKQAELVQRAIQAGVDAVIESCCDDGDFDGGLGPEGMFVCRREGIPSRQPR